MLVVVACMVVLVLDHLRDSRSSARYDPTSLRRDLSRDEVAVLAGGTARLGLVSVMALVQGGDVDISQRGLIANGYRLETGSPFDKAAFSAIQRQGRDMHDVRDYLRECEATRALLQDLVEAGLVRRWGAWFARRPNGSTSWFASVAVILLAWGVLFLPFMVLSAIRGDELDRALDGDPGAFSTLGAGVVLIATLCRLARRRTRAGTAALRAVRVPDDELWAVARRGVRGINDRSLRKAMRASQATPYMSGGG